MALKVTEIDVQIVVAELPRKDDGTPPVMVTRIEDELVFARLDMDSFILEVAGALDNTFDGQAAEDFELRVSQRALGLALRRLSENGLSVKLRTSLDEDSDMAGYLTQVGRSQVAFLAPCGERHVFSRRDLESVLEIFG